MENSATKEYKEFLIEKRAGINRYLNMVLWFFAIAGPLVTIGIQAGFFPNISYYIGIDISVAVVIMSVTHMVLTKKYPKSIFTCFFAFVAMDVIIAYLAYSNLNIHVAWFLVPLLSLLFCDMRFYLCALLMNYVLMAVTTLKSAEYHASVSSLHGSAMEWFSDTLFGNTIEMILVGAAGLILVTIVTGYIRELFTQSNKLLIQESTMSEKMHILDSMAEIYDNVNLLDFINNTETSLRDPEQKTYHIDMPVQTHTLMNQRLKKKIATEQLDDFLTFTNITTVVERLTNKKLISADFIDVTHGWFRAQYIMVEATDEGVPTIAIYTTRNVDEERRREEHLMHLSYTDEMTNLSNRRCYEMDLKKNRDKTMTDDFVLFSIDVNGLKQVNDSRGHEAGDELICGAAECIALCADESDRIYRTGGDEFMAAFHTDDPEKVRSLIMEKAAQWHGDKVEDLSLSIGYAAGRDHRDASLDDLERMADSDMYKEKEKYYRESGLDRRRKNI